MNRFFRSVGSLLADYLNARVTVDGVPGPVPVEDLERTVRPGDVILVEGDRRISLAIKYLTQSTWSHAVLFVGDSPGAGMPAGPCIVEADLAEGVRVAPLSTLAGMHLRICRPFGLEPVDCSRVIAYAIARVGHRYDLKNVLDLARYLLPMPPVPVRFRRRLIALGSGDPTRAICSTLIAQAFQSVRFPILPRIEAVPASDPDCDGCRREILHIRHHSLFAPRDFDLSPYFDVIKPRGPDDRRYTEMEWGEAEPG